MLRETILDIFGGVWPMIIIICTILITLRITYLIVEKKSFVFYKEVFVLLFIIYIMSLFHTVTFQDVNWSSSNFIPFKEMFRYRFGSRLFLRNVVGNVLMFLPYGFFLHYFIRKSSDKLAFLLITILSFTIEFTQLCIGRVFDVDDIILNILGGMIGFYFFYYLNSIREKFPKILKKNWFYNIIVVVFLIIMVLYLMGVSFV